MSMSEFGLIDRFFSTLTESVRNNNAAINLSIGDDCALLTIPEGQQLALSIDTLNADVHFPSDAPANLIAQRALAVSVSDLAAMGASPLAFTLALSLPSVDTTWLADFSQGLKQAASKYNIALIGGDTTHGLLSISIQVHGTVPKSCALLRSGAQVGDLIYVSGTLGDAAAALEVIQGRLSLSENAEKYLKLRYYQPRARIEVGESLHDLASAAIDISDGLAADLGHILRSSGVAAELYCAELPLSNALIGAYSLEEARLLALTGGDDYELCFTAPPSKRDALTELAELLDVPLKEVGRIVMGKGLKCLDANGDELKLTYKGYQHF